MATPQGGYLVSQAHRLSSQALDQTLAAHGCEALSGIQGRVFYVLLSSENGACLSEIAEKTALPKPTLTGVVDRMEKAGIVRREAVAGDRRKTRIVLTEQADELAHAYETVSAEMNERFFAGFSDREREELAGYLERIIANLSNQ